MGAIEKSNAIFLSIADGKISRRRHEPNEKTVTRTTKQGKVVHEEFYKGWKGRITDIQVREHKEYGKFWNVTLTDDDGDAILQMNYSSGYSAAFLKILPNIDLLTDVIISPSMKMEGEKKKTSVFVTQHGKPLKHFYTKDSPNGLPQLKKIKVKGKEQWDDSDMMEFFENMVNSEIMPKLKKPAGVKKVDVVDVDDMGDPIEDLPF